jgi:hypothetical protein
MDKNGNFPRKVFPLVISLFLIPLACTINTSILATPGIKRPDPAAAGLTRKNPVPLNTLISIPGWDIKVIEFLRGEAALAVVNAAEWQADPLPAGQEFALAKIFVRCTSLDENYHSLGISEMSMTGSRNVTYGDTMDSWPQPEFLFEDMYTAEAVEGWIDAVIPTDEQNLMVILNVEENGNRSTRFLALEEGASVSLPADISSSESNALGVEIIDPAPAGQVAISPDWEISVLESIRGQEAEAILEKDNSNYSPPEAGAEYLLLRVRLRYISPEDLPVWVGADKFSVANESSSTISGGWIYLPPGSGRAWISNTILPGAELEGWVALTMAAGEANPVIAFHPDEYSSMGTDQNLRYLAIK